MSNILNPPDEKELAQRRVFVRPGSATGQEIAQKPRESVPILQDVPETPQPVAIPQTVNIPQEPQQPEPILQDQQEQVLIPQGQPMPVPSNPEVEQPLGTPMPKTGGVGSPQFMGQDKYQVGSGEQSAEPSETGNAIATTPGRNDFGMSNIRYSPTEMPVPNLNGVAALSEMFSSTAIRDRQLQEIQQRHTPEALIQTWSALPFTTIEHSGMYEYDLNKLNDELAANREESLRIVRANRVGLNDGREDGTGGEVITGTSATDNALVGNGTQSSAGQSIQDRTDPTGSQNTRQGILGWAQNQGNRFVDFVHDTLSYVGEGLSLEAPESIGGSKGADARNQTRREAGAKERGSKNVDTDPYNLNKLAPVTESGNTKKKIFDPMNGKFADFGSHPLMSGAMYYLNLNQSVATGAVTDVSDAIGITKKPSYDQRSRTLAAIQGQDNSFSAPKSETAPFSVQAPEGKESTWQQRAGGFALDVVVGTASDALVGATIGTVVPGAGTAGGAIVGGFVGAGRVIVKTIIKQADGSTAKGIVREAEQQAARQVGSEVTEQVPRQVDNATRNSEGIAPPNKPASHKDPIIPHTSEAKTGQVVTPRSNDVAAPPKPKADTSVVKLPNRVEIQTSNRMPDANTKPGVNSTITTTINTKPFDASNSNVRDVFPVNIKELPSGERLTNRVGEGSLKEAPLTDGDLAVVRRTPDELSSIARLTIDPSTGKPILETNRTLSDLEIAHLNEKFGNTFDVYGKPVPDLDNVNLIETPDGFDEIVRQPLKSESSVYNPSIKDIGKLQDQISEVGKQINKAIETGATNTGALINKLEKLSTKLMRSVKDKPGLFEMHLDRGELPSTLDVRTREGLMLGDELVQTGFKLDAQRHVIDQLTDEVDTMKFHLNNTETELKSLKTVGRGDLFNGLTTKQVMGIDQPELRITPYVSKLIPPIEQIPVRPTGANSFLDENPLWLHGSDSSVGIRERDVMSGGTPSEHGLGIYLTKDQDVADQAANGFVQSNRPPRPDSAPGIPHRTTVDTSRLVAPIDLNAKPSAAMRKVFNEAAESVGLPPKFADNLSSTSKAWDEFKIRYHEQFGQVPETVNREFQQKVLVGIQKIGHDSGVFVDKMGNPHLVVYQPHKLSPIGGNVVLETPTLAKQFEARAWLDERTFQTNPSEVSRVNAVKSKLQHQTMTQQTFTEHLARERFKQRETMADYIKMTDELEAKNYERTRKLLESQPQEPRLDIKKEIRDNNNPCL